MPAKITHQVPTSHTASHTWPSRQSIQNLTAMPTTICTKPTARANTSTVMGSSITLSRGAGRPLPSGTERKGTAGWGRPSMPVNCTRKSEKNPPVSSPITADETPHMVISRMSWPKPPFGRTLCWMNRQAPARSRP